VDPIELAPGIIFRTVVEADAGALARAYDRNREHLARWDPRREQSFYTVEHQRAVIIRQLREQAEGRMVRWVFAAEEEVVGVATLSNIIFGAFRSADLGYWIDASHLGKGLATGAVTAICAYANSEIALHRVAAGTLIHNVRSQRVLAKCGFQQYGLAPKYLYIDGEWQDHLRFQKILNSNPA
jgi:[ribosomal protein S5]-alanine N-acetyltransferase